MHLWSLLVWIPGLFFLLRKNEGKEFRPLGWLFVAVLLLFLGLSGKSYYTLGAYPVLMAAGGVFWENRWRVSWKATGSGRVRCATA